MKDMLSVSSDLPERVFEVGEVVVREGEAGDGIWVLVSGALQVSKGGALVNTINRPGSLVGEISVLLDVPFSATVRATERSVLRHAGDGHALLSRDPDITMMVAKGLAERLNFVTTYLADLKLQYGDAPGLTMVSKVLQRLGHRQGPAARPGSARDPNAEY
jgi:CRP/FNR family transcriptional regulator, cyclic AMP receptor protein